MSTLRNKLVIVDDLPVPIRRAIREFGITGEDITIAYALETYLLRNSIVGYNTTLLSFMEHVADEAHHVIGPKASNALTLADLEGVKEWMVHGHQSKSIDAVTAFLKRTYENLLKTSAVSIVLEPQVRVVTVYVGKGEAQRKHVQYRIHVDPTGRVGNVMLT
jgi:hypothetical protein